jgi:hypothetical protein
MKIHLRSIHWAALAIGLLVGVLAVLLIRFFTYQPEQVHYHANFAVYVNGQREEFKGAQYYQEVAACTAEHGFTNPQQRAHMHDNINDVVHVHDHAVTWGQFFNNIGWAVSSDIIETDSGTKYIADGANKVHVLVNGQDYTDITSVANMIIKDRSKLLVSYGDISDAELQTENNSIASTAKKYDEGKDPASCAGSEHITASDRLHHLF